MQPPWCLKAPRKSTLPPPCFYNPLNRPDSEESEWLNRDLYSITQQQVLQKEGNGMQAEFWTFAVKAAGLYADKGETRTRDFLQHEEKGNSW